MGVKYFIGIDEAGRGPLAGPVCVAAVAIVAGRGRRFLRRRAGEAPVVFGRRGKVATNAAPALRDSKRLSPLQREWWFQYLLASRRAGQLDYAVAFVGERVIDERGITAAVRLGVGRCLYRLGRPPEACRIFLDGALRAPAIFTRQETIVRGDETVPLIALASIVAKVKRDRRMRRLARKYPVYGFEKHKGYGTRTHYQILKRHGFSPIHRRTFVGEEA